MAEDFFLDGEGLLVNCGGGLVIRSWWERGKGGEVPRGALRSSSLAFQYFLICASETLDAFCSASVRAGGCSLIASSLGCSTSSSITSSALGTSSGNGSGVETSSDSAFTRVSEAALSCFLEEGAGSEGLVTLFAEVRGPKARVCWAERGLEDLRREGGIIVVQGV